MADAYTGEIRLFGGNYAPKNWALCNGQLLPISSNTVLFSILGVQYGGDGRTNFALPNLNGNTAMGQGAGPGLTPRTVGESVGAPAVTLNVNELPAHTHHPQAVAAPGNSTAATGNLWAETPKQGRGGTQLPLYGATSNVPLSAQAINTAGGNQPHNNMQPFLAMNYIICLYGEFPVRQ
ncbi:phage tail protein [Cohnella nanjingensis]|uniref:Phage tail protein n=1 Tax=Cohnella nanjingensis TaxID=1387779 RepID=A0A7X0VHS9_9BACL|nr:tail fiber protein [Cohnella nanjingensis]MBB6672969.1 phage tail protein [Cohnella nanjingensis]